MAKLLKSCKDEEKHQVYKKINFSTYSDLCFLSIHVLACNLIMIEKKIEMYKLENMYMKLSSPAIYAWKNIFIQYST